MPGEASDDVVQRIVASVGAAALRLGQSLTSDAQVQAIAQRLGWKLDTVPPALRSLGDTLRTIGPLVDAARDDGSPQTWAALIQAIADGANAVDELAHADFGPALAALGFGDAFPKQLLQWIAIEHLRRAHPRLFGVLRASGVVVSRAVDPGAGRPPYVDERVAVPDFGSVISSPSSLLRTAWAWGQPDLEAAAFLDQIGSALRRFGIAAGFQLQPASARELSGQAPIGSRWHLVARLLAGATTEGAYELGLRWLVFEVDGLRALAIIPYVEGTLSETVSLGSYELAITGMGTAGEQAAIVIAPTSIALIDDFRGTGAAAAPHATFRLALKPAEVSPLQWTFGDGGVLNGTGWVLQATVDESDVGIELAFADAQFGLATGSGLLRAAGVAERAALPLPFAIGVSYRRGIYVGSADGSPLVLGTVALGPVRLQDTTLALAGVDAGFKAIVTCNAAVSVGPLSVTLAGVGAALELRFPGSGGNLGPLDVSATAVPPTGGAVALDTPVVKGGGSIAHVSGRDYRGALVLETFGVAAAALGVLDDSPDSRGAFVAIAGARFPHVQLGWGFTLDGIGGVIATHRTCDVAEIRTSLARGSVSTLLQFDPAENDLLSRVDALASAFPAAPGRYVVGPTCSLGWGTPQVARADLALLLELPSPIEVVLLGSLAIGLPTLDHRIVDLRLDMLGVLDLARNTLALDASLHDSSLAGYPLAGNMALRTGWGSDKYLLLAIGGFHPRFTPPPGFPALRRLSLSAGDNPSLQLDAYLALTSNTAQVGTHAQLAYHGGGFDIAASLGFDALFEFVPFHFEVDIAAGASISWHGHHLLGVSLDGKLSGPHPWHAKGDATFSILWWDVSVGFDQTWGDGAPPPLPPAPDVAARLGDALRAPEAWSFQLAPGDSPWVTTASTDRGHPHAALVVRQRAAPLDYDIDQLDTIPLPAAQRYSIATATVGTSTLTPPVVTDAFAPAQFTQMSADDRLVAPSFEQLHAGVSIGAAAVAHGATVTSPMDIETVNTDPLAPPDLPVRSVLDGALANGLVKLHTEPVAPVGPTLSPLRYALATVARLQVTPETTAIASGATSYNALASAARRAGVPLQVVTAAELG